jgi:hypothetical protein
MALLISALLALGGGSIIIFAPGGKQLLANWVAAICFVSAGGAAGYKRLDQLHCNSSSDGPF